MLSPSSPDAEAGSLIVRWSPAWSNRETLSQRNQKKKEKRQEKQSRSDTESSSLRQWPVVLLVREHACEMCACRVFRSRASVKSTQQHSWALSSISCLRIYHFLSNWHHRSPTWSNRLKQDHGSIWSPDAWRQEDSIVLHSLSKIIKGLLIFMTCVQSWGK